MMKDVIIDDMINYWQQEDGLLVKRDKSKLDSSKNLWIDARNVSSADIDLLEKEYNIDHELLLDFIDPDELSRIEDWDDYIAAIIRLPVFSPNAEVRYHTAPVGAIIFKKIIITICWTNCEVLKDLSENRIKGLMLSDFPAFITRILSRADTMFLRYLKEINRRTNSIQTEFTDSMANSELISLLNIEKSLQFFTTSLKSNQLLLEKIRRTKILRLDAEDNDWLDDVEIDNRQAMEMADNYSAITAGTMDAFANVISNNMNASMKKLTVASIVLMVISAITSFYGMNIRLPFGGERNDWLGFIVISAVCAVSAFISLLLMSWDYRRRHILKRRKK